MGRYVELQTRLRKALAVAPCLLQIQYTPKLGVTWEATCALCWKLELLSLQNLGEVDVEEIEVEASLDNARNNGNGVNLMVAEVSPNPVGNIQSAVKTHGSKVMCGDCLCFACSLEHEELREDGHSLEEDGERPKDFCELEFIVEDEAENDARSNKIFHFEGVNCGVMCWSVLDLHEVEDVASAGDEEDLHNAIV